MKCERCNRHEAIHVGNNDGRTCFACYAEVCALDGGGEFASFVEAAKGQEVTQYAIPVFRG